MHAGPRYAGFNGGNYRNLTCSRFQDTESEAMIVFADSRSDLTYTPSRVSRPGAAQLATFGAAGDAMLRAQERLAPATLAQLYRPRRIASLVDLIGQSRMNRFGLSGRPGPVGTISVRQRRLLELGSISTYMQTRSAPEGGQFDSNMQRFEHLAPQLVSRAKMLRRRCEPKMRSD